MISIITPALVKDAQGAQWLNECISSVKGQPGDWEHIVVNDHSPADLSALKASWPHVHWLDAQYKGVSAARNQAAEAAQGELLLPLDADDKLAPDALPKFLEAWDKRGDASIIYSDVVMFGSDYARVYLAAEYSFTTLLRATFMTVGCLHRKADWERIGGWRLDMSQGLEDWEYWLAMGEAGVCGKRVAEPLYWYRRHPRGRLQWLKANHDLWNRAYLAMRELHKDSYNGRYPMGCCGGSRAKAVRRAAVPVSRAATAAAPRPAGGGLVQMVYRGPRKGDFALTGGVTRTRYRVPGPGEFVHQVKGSVRGIKAGDVAWFRSVGRGKEFQVVEAPKPAPAVKPAPVVEKPAGPVEKWDLDVMEAEAVDVPDIQDMSVKDIKVTAFAPEVVPVLLEQERGGKNRKSVIKHLEAIG